MQQYSDIAKFDKSSSVGINFASEFVISHFGQRTSLSSPSLSWLMRTDNHSGTSLNAVN